MKNDYPNLEQCTLDEIAKCYMDDDLRERIHSQMAPCHPGEFLTEYLRLSNDPDFEYLINDELKNYIECCDD